MRTSKNTSGATEAFRDQTKQVDNSSNSTSAQRRRLLAALKKGAISTIQARRDLDIMMPAARIFELKHNEGHNIATIWTTEETQIGRPHRVAKYILKTELNKNIQNGVSQ